MPKNTEVLLLNVFFRRDRQNHPQQAAASDYGPAGSEWPTSDGMTPEMVLVQQRVLGVVSRSAVSTTAPPGGALKAARRVPAIRLNSLAQHSTGQSPPPGPRRWGPPDETKSQRPGGR